MPPLLDAPTGSTAYAEARHAQGDFTPMTHLELLAPSWLPRGDFRPLPELVETPISRLPVEAGKTQPATPTVADFSESASERRRERETRRFLNVEPGPQRESAIRLELLARKYASNLSPEEDARLKVATEKLRRLLPRVTAQDFEAIADISEKISHTAREVDALRLSLGIEK